MRPAGAGEVPSSTTPHSAPIDSASGSRSVILNQTLLCAAVVIAGIVLLLPPGRASGPAFLVGQLTILAGGAAAFIVPWEKVGRRWILLVPTVDIVAIALLRYAEPAGGLGLLWAFPAMWMSSLGLAGFVTQFVTITGLYLFIASREPSPTSALATVLLPVVIFAIATTSFVNARRHRAQRDLLDKQAILLSAIAQRAEHQERLLADVLDSVDFGVLRIGPSGDVTVINEAFGSFQDSIPGFARPDADLPDAYDADGLTPLEEDRRPIRRAVRGEEFDNQVVWFGPPDRPQRAISMTARRTNGARGQDLGIVLVARDVTAELTALRARDRLVASVSHELRTPLTSILGFIDLALESLDRPEVARKDLEVAARNGDRLLQIIADILAASSSSSLSTTIAVSPQDTDLVPLVGAAVESWSARAAERDITIDTSEVRPARAYVDSARTRQVVDNLFSNAIKYGRTGGHVLVSTSARDGDAWIVVRDDGVGISESDQLRLFQPYFRASSAVAGTGLGLSISRDIVRAQGGDISVKSIPGSGSTFVVRLPEIADRAARRPAKSAPADEVE